ncbi:MAG: hypothetical protein MJY63_05630 [Paludibacteraceae bacterium]|nr:hypothetical protein [Paludibacteraceae bacterium]
MKPVKVITATLLTGCLIAIAVMYCQIINEGSARVALGGNIDKTADMFKEDEAKMFETLRFLSAEDGAKLYSQNYKDIPYLTEMYTERIIPGLSNENILTLKHVYNKYIIHTPASAKFAEMYRAAKASYMKKVKTDMFAINNSLYKSFENELLPHMVQGVDSMINSDMQAVVDHAIGDVVGNRKSLPGKIERVKEKWNEVMLADKYVDFEQSCVDVYTHQLDEFQKSYFESVTLTTREQPANKVDLSVTIPLGNAIMIAINDYEEADLKEMSEDMARDSDIESPIGLTTYNSADSAAAPLVILYNIGNFEYDTNEPLSKDQLVASCAELVKNHLSKTSFETIKRDVRNMIVNSNDKLINDIDNGLNL